jgi:hypothetical protein
VSQNSSGRVIGRAALRPALFLVVLFGGFFGWPFALAALLDGHEVDGTTGTALALAPMCIVASVMIAVLGKGRNIPPPGDYVLADLPLWARYRRVWSLAGRRRVFTWAACVMALCAFAGAVIGSAALATVSLDVAALTVGIAIGLRRSSQIPGRGPSLDDRFRRQR